MAARPDGTTPIDGATKRINHQYFSYDPAAISRYLYGANPDNPMYNFAPKKFYELNMKETAIQVASGLLAQHLLGV